MDPANRILWWAERRAARYAAKVASHRRRAAELLAGQRER
jgi:hypothetical protein